MLRAGDRIDSFTLIQELGKGGFGVVWLAEERTIFAAPRVALKIALEDKINLEAIKQEASLWVKASGHINVLPIFGVRVCNDQVVIISEYAPDGSLEKWLAQQSGRSPLIETAVDIAYGISAGLEHLHRKGIIHRDLKPANVLLQGETPRLADFGLARLLKSDPRSRNVSGTLPYMAPEVFSGERSEQTDIWSAGVIFYQLLVGCLPFQQQDIRSLMNAIDREDPFLPSFVPDVLKEIVERALQKDPQQRYQSATEMRKALRAASRSLLPPKPDEQKTLVPPQQVDIQRELQPLDPTIQLPSLVPTLSMPPPIVPLPSVQPEQRTSEQAHLTPTAKKFWWITSGFLSLLLVSILMIAFIKKFYRQPLNQKQIIVEEASKLEDAKLHAELGKVWRDRSDWAQAEAEYRKAVKLDLNNADYRLKLAYVLNLQGRNEESKSEYRELDRLARESLRMEPNKAANHYFLGVALSKQAKHGEGEAELKEAIRLNPYDGDSHRELGLTLHSQKKYAEAEMESREAVRLKPNYYSYRVTLGFVLSVQEKYAEAEAEIREAIRLNPGYASSHSNLADALVGQNKPIEAETEYREALRLYPNRPSVHVRLGRLLRAQKKDVEAESHYKEAIRLHREAIKSYPNEPDYYDNLGDVLLERKLSSEAETAYREAIRLDADGDVYHNDLGRALAYQKKYSGAEKAYREAIRLNPTEPIYHNNLGDFLLERKQEAEAESAFREAIRLNPTADYRNGLGVALERQKKYAEAETEFREAIRLDPSEALYHNNLGIALDKQKKKVAAEAEYKEAKRLKKKQ